MGVISTSSMLLVLTVQAAGWSTVPQADEAAPSSVRMVDVDGDGRLDRLISASDGTLAIALNRGGRVFEQVAQELPAVVVSSALAEDLDGDGYLDLYLVSPQANAALSGDGTGRFHDATSALGLADQGPGVGAELRDMDSDGTPDLLLHNLRGDVVFWGSRGGAFERDAATAPLPVDDAVQAAAALLLERSMQALARDPDREVVLTLDEHGRPVTSFGRGGRARAAHEAPADRHGQPPGASLAGPAIAPAAAPPHTLFGLTSEEKEILSHQSIVYLPDGVGGQVKTLRMSDLNLQLVNGAGSTATANGLGNLIVGYNETGNIHSDTRTGSHNIVGGRKSSFSSYGGLVVGEGNLVSGPWASVSGGSKGRASGTYASVSGGRANRASGPYASVSGGYYNTASADHSAVSGGKFSAASGFASSVSGGSGNTASGSSSAAGGGRGNLASGVQSWAGGGSLNTASWTEASVSGGRGNTASGPGAAVSGGWYNEASGVQSSVSGGKDNAAGGAWSSVSGGLFNTASGTGASVSGGRANTAGGQYASVSGGVRNEALAGWSSVSGGADNTAVGTYASVSGGYLNTAGGPGSSVSGGVSRSAATYGSWAAGTYSYQ